VYNLLVEAKDIRFYYLAYPKIVALITSGTFESGNVMAASWNTPVSFEPPLFAVAISPERYTYSLVKKYGEFGVNFLPYELSEKVFRVGNVSGRDVDKFSKFDLTTFRGKYIKAPLIDESLSAFECKVVKEIETGDHILFVGEVIQAWYRSDFFDDRGRINLAKTSPAFHVGGRYFAKIDGESVIRIQ